MQPGGGSTATANAVYCLRTIVKDLMEQLNSEQLLAFVEVPPDVAAAAVEQQAAAAQGEQPSPAPSPQPSPQDGAPGGGTGRGSGGGEPEFSRLHNGSLVQTLVREAMLTLADDKLL